MSLHHSQTIAILKKMSRPEMKELGSYINSGFSKATPQIKKAFTFLASCYPDFDKSKCSNELFSAKVLRKGLDKKTNKEINRLMSEFNPLIENYVVLKMVSLDPNFKYDALTKWYKSRNLKMQMNKVFKQIEYILQHETNADKYGIYKNYLLNKISQQVERRDYKQSFLIQNRFLHFLSELYRIESYITNIGIDNVAGVLSKDALLKKSTLKITTEFLTLTFEKEIKFYKAQQQFIKNPSIKMYSYLKNLIQDTTLRIDDYDRRRAVTLLINNISVLFSGAKFHEEALLLSEFIVQLDLKINNGFLTPNVYREAILGYCDLHKSKEANQFQKKIGNNISSIINVDEYIAIYRAFVRFEEKNYAEALKIVSNCAAETVIAGLDIRRLKIKLAFRLNNKNMMETHVNNLRKYISTNARKQINTKIFKNTLLLANYALKLFKISPSQKKELSKLKKQVEEDISFNNNSWILEEIEEKLSHS